MTERDGERHRTTAHQAAALLFLFVLATAGAYPLEVLVTSLTSRRFDLVPSSKAEIGLLAVFTVVILVISIRNSRARIAAAARHPHEPTSRQRTEP